MVMKERLVTIILVFGRFRLLMPLYRCVFLNKLYYFRSIVSNILARQNPTSLERTVGMFEVCYMTLVEI